MTEFVPLLINANADVFALPMTFDERKILNPICHVVVPGSSDFEDLAVVFSAHVLRENKKHVYLSGKI